MKRGGFDPFAYRDPMPTPWVIGAMTPLVRHLVLPWVLKVRAIEWPTADAQRLRALFTPGRATFVGPNHPEFMTDWMLDKELSSRVSPWMAHWASYEIVNLNRPIQAVWLRNNLIANPPGGRGRDYSIRWATQGHGVLLHPEGTATWHADAIGTLVPGIVEMAWETCGRARDRGDTLETFVAPVIWKLHFAGDASRPLARELALIERGLSLPREDGLPLERRFGALLARLLERQAARLEALAPRLEAGRPGLAYFAAAERQAAHLTSILCARYGAVDGSAERVSHVMRRRIRERANEDPARARLDRLRVLEIERLDRFPRSIYGGETLTQEQIAETLKRIRCTLLVRGLGGQLHSVVPVPVAPRIAHVRVPEPLAIHEAWTAGAEEGAARRSALLAELRARMQATLDRLRAEIEPRVAPFRRVNPFAG